MKIEMPGTSDNPGRLMQPTSSTVVAAEPVTSVDITSADTLIELKRTLDASQIELYFAEMKDPVQDKLKRFQLLRVLGTDIFHPTIGAAVDDYLEQYKIEWNH